MNRTCECCKYYFKDHSVNYSECFKYDDMTEEQTDKHFTNNEPDCPCFKRRAE